MPWRIFAIPLHYEDETGAPFDYGAWPDLLVGAQPERMGTRVRVFRPGSDRRLEWVECAVGGARLDRPCGAAVAGDFVVLGVWEADGVVYLVSAREMRAWRVSGN